MQGISKYSSKSIDQLESVVIERFGVSKMELRSRLRIGSNARQIMFYLLNKHFLYSSTQIGRMYNRDHSTVLAGIKKVSNYKMVSQQADQLFLKCLQAVDNDKDNMGINLPYDKGMQSCPPLSPDGVVITRKKKKAK